jgi:hypothetical protein
MEMKVIHHPDDRIRPAESPDPLFRLADQLPESRLRIPKIQGSRFIQNHAGRIIAGVFVKIPARQQLTLYKGRKSASAL